MMTISIAFTATKIGALAVDIGEMAGVAGKQRRGQDEQNRDQLDVIVAAVRQPG